MSLFPCSVYVTLQHLWPLELIANPVKRTAQYQSHREREMHAIWVSLKENVNCGSSRRWTDVVRRPEKISMDRRCIFKKENPNGEIGHRKEEQVREMIFRQNHPRNWYCGEQSSLLYFNTTLYQLDISYAHVTIVIYECNKAISWRTCTIIVPVLPT